MIPHLSRNNLVRRWIPLVVCRCPLYHSSADDSPFALDPFWAVLWPGSYAIGRYVTRQLLVALQSHPRSSPSLITRFCCRFLIEHPERVRGKRVLDFAAGCGVGALLCVSDHLGAASACANEIDPLAIAACRLNARHQQLHLSRPTNSSPVPFSTCSDNLVGHVSWVADNFDVVLAGDVCYEEALAKEVTTWLCALAEKGV